MELHASINKLLLDLIKKERFCLYDIIFRNYIINLNHFTLCKKTKLIFCYIKIKHNKK